MNIEKRKEILTSLNIIQESLHGIYLKLKIIQEELTPSTVCPNCENSGLSLVITEKGETVLRNCEPEYQCCLCLKFFGESELKIKWRDV